MIQTNLDTFRIHKLTKEQYNAAKAAGDIQENELYMTPEENVDLSDYATKDYVNENGGKIDVIKVNGEVQPITNKEVDITVSTSDDSVTLSTEQTIAGAKTFSAPVTVNNDIVATGNITGAKVYNAVWNDYAEWFEKENLDEDFEAGDACFWDTKGVTKENTGFFVGIVSDTYGHILGGRPLEDMEDNRKEFVPIGLVGRVKCKVKGKVNIGDYIGINATGDIIANSVIKYTNDIAIERTYTGTYAEEIIGRALEDKDTEDIGIITILLK